VNVKRKKSIVSMMILGAIILSNFAVVRVTTAEETAATGELGVPAIAFTRDDFGVDTTDLEGSTIASFGDLQDRYSLDGNVLAGAKLGRDGKRNVVVFDATTKERLSLIKNALSPIAFKGGRKIAFGGAFRRDHSVNSLWVRNLEATRTRKVVQFSIGGSTPGVKTGFRGENSMLETAIDRAGGTAVIVQGNDIDLFIYDAWSINMKSGKATRLTKGKRSRHASISPNGEQVSLLREDVDGFCGGPEPGYRAGDIVVMDPDGSNKRVLINGDCDVFYDQPRWLNDSTLVARRLTRIEGEEFRASELVFIDVPSGMDTKPLTTGVSTNVGNFAVSSKLGVVAYDDFMNPGGFFVFDPSTGSTRVSPEGRFPHLKGENIAPF
jgi:hypothetical protein